MDISINPLSRLFLRPQNVPIVYCLCLYGFITFFLEFIYIWISSVGEDLHTWRVVGSIFKKSRGQPSTGGNPGWLMGGWRTPALKISSTLRSVIFLNCIANFVYILIAPSRLADMFSLFVYLWFTCRLSQYIRNTESDAEMINVKWSGTDFKRAASGLSYRRQLYRYLLGGAEQSHEILSQNNRSLLLDSSQN
jgi:hypothetical protein